MRTDPSSDSRYQAGEVVFAKENPELALVVRRYIDRIYYCRVRDDADHQELVYFDRELL